MAKPLKALLGGVARVLIVKAVNKALTPKAPKPPRPQVPRKVQSKVDRARQPQNIPRKETPMNPVFVGALRHVIQISMGALGATSLASGAGFELAVAVAVSALNLGWFLVENFLKTRKV